MISATSNNSDTAAADGGSGGGLNVTALTASANLEGSTTASLGGNDTIIAGEVDILAQGNNTPSATSVLANVSVLGGAGANVTAKSTHTVTAEVAPGTMLQVQNASKFDVSATSTTNATATPSGGSAGLGTATAFLASAEVDGSTDAFIAGNDTINAGEVDVTASANNTVTTDMLAIALSVIGAGVGIVQDTIGQTVAADVDPAAQLTMNGNKLDIRATSTNTDSATANGGAFGGISAAAFTVAANLNGSTSAFIGGKDTISAGDVEVTASASNNDSEAFLNSGRRQHPRRR